MNLLWKKMGGKRHLQIDGQSLCGLKTIEQSGSALPCPLCLGKIQTAINEAFTN